MNITIEAAKCPAALVTAACIRKQVFGEQHSYQRLPSLELYEPSEILTLIATATDTKTPIATLSIVDTTSKPRVHGAVGLAFPKNERVARYTQMAVLKPYRGLHLPATLMAEAHRRFVIPRQIMYTWLLFPADTASRSYFCTTMGFIPGTSVLHTEYGRSLVLVRDERAVAPLDSAADRTWVLPPAIGENEWLAQ